MGEYRYIKDLVLAKLLALNIFTAIAWDISVILLVIRQDDRIRCN